MQPMNQGPPGMQPMPAQDPSLPPQLGGQGPDPAQYINQMTPEQKSMFSQMAPEQQQQFLQLLASDFEGQMSTAESDMTRADAVRQGEGPRGRYAGGMYVAANPLEHIASGMQKYQANKDFKTAQTARGDASTRAEELRKQTMDMLAGKM